MKIDDLRETADLAHLNLDEAELAAAFPAFEQMLGFFAAMQSADEDREAFPAPISGLSHTALTVSADYFRPDTPGGGGFPQIGAGSLLDNAGERDGRFIVVPNVL